MLADFAWKTNGKKKRGEHKESVENKKKEREAEEFNLLSIPRKSDRENN